MLGEGGGEDGDGEEGEGDESGDELHFGEVGRRSKGVVMREAEVVEGLGKVVGRTEGKVEGLEQRWQRRYKEGYTAEGAGQESVCLGERGRKEEGAIYAAPIVCCQIRNAKRRPNGLEQESIASNVRLCEVLSISQYHSPTPSLSFLPSF